MILVCLLDPEFEGTKVICLACAEIAQHSA